MTNLDLQETRQIVSVSELTRQIRFLLESSFSGLWIEGQISNFKLHTSGHMYFSLKDDQAQIQCVMFAQDNRRLSFVPEEGLQVLCFGRVSVYGPRGQYQLYAQKMEPKGIGALQLRFEQLKEKLKQEGLFDPSRKRPIPFLPRTIGLVTSIDGAAFRDIMHVLDRRFLSAHLVICPVQVQGASAAGQIAEAVEAFNRWGKTDVIILARGGGSLEDLWAFNEEAVARAIAGSEVPVISAIGHETDFTISDFVADLRAATPSAAAEIVLPEKEDLLAHLEDQKSRVVRALTERLKNFGESLSYLTGNRCFENPLLTFETKVQRLDEFKKNAENYFETFFRFRKEAVGGLLARLESLGPAGTLKRGFSVTVKLPGGEVVKSVSVLKQGDTVKTKLFDGSFTSRVEQID